MSPSLRPLDGVTVVSLEHAIAAPLCTRHLADLGARVIKVERPGRGDFARDYVSRVRGLASHFVWVNRSKESLTLDLKQPAARAVLMDLLAGADVLVQNLAPGAAAPGARFCTTTSARSTIRRSSRAAACGCFRSRVTLCLPRLTQTKCEARPRTRWS